MTDDTYGGSPASCLMLLPSVPQETNTHIQTVLPEPAPPNEDASRFQGNVENRESMHFRESKQSPGAQLALPALRAAAPCKPCPAWRSSLLCAVLCAFAQVRSTCWKGPPQPPDSKQKNVLHPLHGSFTTQSPMHLNQRNPVRWSLLSIPEQYHRILHTYSGSRSVH